MQALKFENVTRKIHSLETLNRKLVLWRMLDKKIVFTNGCFDLLHYGHIDYLAKAASLGDELVIGLNSDASVRQNKGPGRPINDEKSRQYILASLSFVSAVILFDASTPLDLIRKVGPDILVKGGDYIPEDVVGFADVTGRGGKVICLDFVPGYSTSALEKKIRDAGN